MMELNAARAELDKIAGALEEEILIWNERRILERRELAIIAKLAKSVTGDLTANFDEMFARMEALHERGPLPAPPHRAIRITTAGGKSRRLRELIVSFVRRAKKAGLPHRVLVLVPTHDLAAEAGKDIAPDIKVMIWQGRAAAALPDKKVKMCLNLKAVKAAITLGAAVQSSVCRYKDTECPSFKRCQYQQRRATVGAADVVFAAHEILFKRPETFGEFGLVVIDEAFWQAGLKGIDPEIGVEIAGLHLTLGEYPVREGGVPCDEHTQILREMIECLQGALKNEPDYVRRAVLEAAGLRLLKENKDGKPRHAIHLEWARKFDTGIRPHADLKTMQAAAEKYGPFLGKMSARVAVWHELDALLRSGEEATGRLALKTVDGRQFLRILQRRKVDKDLLALPIVVADATLPFEIARHYLPDLQLACDIEIEAPHQNIVQVTGVPIGKLSTRPCAPGERTSKEEERVAAKRQRLVDLVRLWLPGPRKLVITYQGIEKDFDAVADTAHWNAFEGRNQWEDVDSLVVIGRPMPHGTPISAMAAALTGKPVVAGDGVKQVRTIRDAAGVEHRIACWAYAGCPEAEMIRAAIVEAAIVQAVGRARGINRGFLDPVEVVLILNDVVVPGLPVDAVVEFEDLRVALMIDAGIVPQWPGDAYKLYRKRKLFTSRDAAKKAYSRAALTVKKASSQRVELVTRLKISSFKAVTSSAVPYGVRYRTGGRGSESRLAWVDAAKVPDPRGVLEAALGPLVEFEMLPQPYRPLPAWVVRAHAEACIEAAAVQMEETGNVDHEVLQGYLRAALASNGFPPLAVAAELERIVAHVLEVPGRPPLDDWIMTDLSMSFCPTPWIGLRFAA